MTLSENRIPANCGSGISGEHQHYRTPQVEIVFGGIVRTILLIMCAALLSGCLGMPESVKPVSGFELNNYLGKWYEVARLDHSFERGLSQVTAEYSMRNDGGVSVLNRGYSEAENKWKEAEGKAYFVNSPMDGYLKVSLFGPF